MANHENILTSFTAMHDILNDIITSGAPLPPGPRAVLLSTCGEAGHVKQLLNAEVTRISEADAALALREVGITEKNKATTDGFKQERNLLDEKWALLNNERAALAEERAQLAQDQD